MILSSFGKKFTEFISGEDEGRIFFGHLERDLISKMVL
jgi:hypothetical protein